MLDYLLSYEQAISFLRYCGNTIVVAGQYRLLIEQHAQLVRSLGLGKSYGTLMIPRHGAAVLMEYLPTLPLVLVEVVVGYGHLHHDDPEDLDEIYDRLLKIDIR